MTNTYQDRPTKALIKLANLENNYRIVKRLCKTKIMAMIKADAYGHGMVRIAKELSKFKVDYFGVAYLEEALELRANQIQEPILVLGAINTGQIAGFIENDIEITSSSIEKSLAISKVAKKMGKKALVHLKVDTGMGRIGVQWHNAYKFIKESYKMENLKIKGLFSHFALADEDANFTQIQLARFKDLVKQLEKENLRPEIVHLANSAGLINFKESHFDMVRPGLMLYGYAPWQKFGKLNLKPVMSLISTVTYFKVLPKNTGISYGHSYKTKTQSRIVTLPLGYGDGYFRALSNKGFVIIRNHKYPIAGNICMDQMMIDIGENGTAYNGDPVLIFGEYENSSLSLEELCEKINTIPYEFLCSITKRVPRIYI